MIKSFVEVQPSRKKILFSIKKMYRNTQVVGDCFFSLYTLATVKDIREGAEE